MGPYCRYCNNRCFVIRVVPGQGEMLLATCRRGMEHDSESCGYDQTTAQNPALLEVR